jgi:heme a synthase
VPCRAVRLPTHAGPCVKRALRSHAFLSRAHPEIGGESADPYPRGVPTVSTAAATNPWLRRVVLVNLILEIGIVLTGGLVRLSGSGLGCPTWPQCVPGSFTPVPHRAQGLHQLIEYGNRTLTSVVGIAAVLVIVAVWRWAPDRRALRRISVLPLAGVLLQAILGGITVLTGLNPAIVAAHFLASMILVALSAYLLYRVGEGDGPPVARVRPEIRWLAGVVATLGVVILVLGTVVTGSGPHSGDASTPRFGLDPRTISWLHADAVMLFAGLVVAVLLAVHLTAADQRPRRVWQAVLAVTLLQGLVGYAQYLTGLPEALVLVHMLGASLLAVSLTYGVLSLRHR